ncbi:hypothetical protein [Anaerovorax sp. IOR16]|uniref:hypothetical protein n=1 Tax=Anaerovorax sp. IOR16 TaxID=2773458 RepID=UPI0019D25C6E|nr:hypothetical protein [Anaerovorax sp. IOR16]
MAKYKSKPRIVEAIPYETGIGDGWIVLYSGNFEDYEAKFDDLDSAKEFIKRDGGKDKDRYAYSDGITNDKTHLMIYEEPMIYITTTEGKEIYLDEDCDYMLILDEEKNVKRVLLKVAFDMIYESVD